MKVFELIAKLRKMPQDVEVRASVLDFDDNRWHCGSIDLVTHEPGAGAVVEYVYLESIKE